MTELELHHDANQLIVPATGEVFDIADAGQAADAWLAVRRLEQQLADVKRVICDRFLEEAAVEGHKTFHYPTATVELRGGPVKVVDVEDLRDRLREAGLPEARLDEVIKTRVEYRVDQRETRSLAAANPRYAEAIQAATTEEPRAFYISVKGAK